MISPLRWTTLLCFALCACAPASAHPSKGVTQEAGQSALPTSDRAADGLSRATFAGGCFWCMETPFEKLPGVTAVLSGYTDGHLEDPTYHEVSAGGSGHTEAIEVQFDPALIAYADLLEVFWRQVDPTDAGGQFVDRGSQYRTGIYYHSELQLAQAELSRSELDASERYEKPVVTPIKPAVHFYPAEEYHQDYYLKKPDDYHRYRNGSGRDRYLDRIWGKERVYELPERATAAAYERPADAELRARLTPMQWDVTQNEATEPPFANEFWDNKREGLYVDIVTGEPLFSSRDKFKSGTGWPSFSRPVEDRHLQQDDDYLLGYRRSEVRSAIGDSHLGHVFEDGPAPTGMRYCINSASLRFVPVAEFDAAGLATYGALFEK
jgi:peptide methionine sulfoxide reductase msrA/msrB